MTTIALRKYRELRRKVTGLKEEFELWRSETADGRPLRLHQAQITALLGRDKLDHPKNRAPLAAFWRDLNNRLGDKPPVPAKAHSFLDQAEEFEYLLLGAHTIWGFFREKLAQRFAPNSDVFLAAADELAWACYRPARNAAKRKTAPPLTYLAFVERLISNEELTGPALRSRGMENWMPVEIPGILRDQLRLKSILQKLPIPILSLPWVQVAHLPDLPIVAHEAGHAVEDDFQLTEELKRLMKTALAKAAAAGRPTGSPEAWKNWVGELFADFHGIAHLGPSYVSTLMDLLSGTHRRSKAEDLSLGPYPTDGLRLRLNRAALASSGYAEEAAEIEKCWLTAVPKDPPAPQFDGAVDWVAKCFMTTPIEGLGKMTLIQLGDWSKKRRQELNPGPLSPLTRDTRLVTAAMRAEYDRNPDAFFPKADLRWRNALKRCQPPVGTRGSVEEPDTLIDLRALLLEARFQ